LAAQMKYLMLVHGFDAMYHWIDENYP